MSDIKKKMIEYITEKYGILRYCARSIVALVGNREVCVNYIKKIVLIETWYPDNYLVIIYEETISLDTIEEKILQVKKSTRGDKMFINILDEIHKSKAVIEEKFKANKKTNEVKNIEWSSDDNDL